MSCGLITNPWISFPDTDGSARISFLQTMPDEFERAELQRIRDRARRLSIQGSPAKTVEERLYQELADVADQLDAFAAREEAMVADLDIQGNITIVTEPVPRCTNPGCCGNPYPKPFIGAVQEG